MDVTSQLNLERETGMGENTERQPVEPASAGGGCGDGRAQARGGQGNPCQPRGRTSRHLLSLPTVFQPRQPYRRTRRLLSCTCSPIKYMFFCFPQKNNIPQNNKPKTTDNKPNQISQTF